MITEYDYTLADPFLAMAASILDGAESERIANENRLRQLTRAVTDKDGEERGFGLMPASVLAARHVGQCGMRECKAMDGAGAHDSELSGLHQFRTLMETIEEAVKADPARPRKPADFLPQVWNLGLITLSFATNEERAIRNLEQLVGGHPLWPAMAPVGGIGKKQFARLLAAVGDPYIRPEIARKIDEDNVVTEPSRPRTRDELKSLCGYGLRDADRDEDHPVDGPVRVAPRRQKGVAMNWSGEARQRAWLITNSGIKQLRKPCAADDELGYVVHPLNDDGTLACQCSVLRAVYDRARAKLATKTHVVPCGRCAPKGKAAEPGSVLSAAHQHLRAQREMAQWIIKLMWRESRDLHWAYLRAHPEVTSPEWVPEVRKLIAEHDEALAARRLAELEALPVVDGSGYASGGVAVSA